MIERPRRSGILGLLQAVARGARRGVAVAWKDLLDALRLCSWNGLRSVRQFPELVRQLRRHGGLRVVTPSDHQPLASTLVTLEGDVVSRVSAELFRQPALWQRHLQAVRRDLAPLRQVPALLRSLSMLLTAITAGIGGYFTLGLTPTLDGGLDELRHRAVELLQQLIAPAAAGGIIGGIRAVLGWWLKAQINKILSP